MEADDFDCALCLRMLFRPVTTVCGHSFCKTCLENACAHQEKCPICRRVLPFHGADSGMPVNLLLDKVLATYFTDEYQSRREEEEVEKADGAGAAAEVTLPIFVLDPILPRQKLGLNVFEPRYVLMIERCLQSTRRFGMIGVQYANHRGHAPIVADFGTEVEIVEIHRGGGRFHLMVVGRRPFQIKEKWHQDGYMVAKAEWLKLDEDPSPLRNAGEDVLELSLSMEKTVESWLQLVRSGGWERNPRHINEILEDLGPIPPSEKPNDRALWVAALINPLPGLGLAPEIRPMVLASDSCSSRLAIVNDALKESMRYITPSTTNIALCRALKQIGISTSQPLLRCLLAIIPWVVVAIGVFVRRALYSEDDSVDGIVGDTSTRAGGYTFLTGDL